LHAAAREWGGHAVCRDAVHVVFVCVRVGGGGRGADHQVAAFGVFAREVEEVDAGEDDEEAAEQGDGVDCVGGVEALEEDEGGAEGAGCEGYVVEGVDTKGRVVLVKSGQGKEGIGDAHVGAKVAQSFVKIVHLRHDGDDGDDEEDVGARVGELIASAKGELESDAQALDGADGNAADGAADAEVDHGVSSAVLGGHPVDHDGCEDDDEEAVEEKT